MIRPRYPVYIPSRGRHDSPLTIRLFLEDGLDFRVVVEREEADAYAAVAGPERVIVLPESDRGLVYARNFIKRHATDAGHLRHWQFDDDVRKVMRLWRGWRLPCSASVALAACEDFVDRYENVALASLNSEFFLPATGGQSQMRWPPFYLNSRCYTVFLVSNVMAPSFRGRYNEDTDMTLQCLSAGWCTVLFNAFMIQTPMTMTHGGGQTAIYVDDGRLKMARELERRWPGVVTTRRRFGRPQHNVASQWTKFDTPLRLKPSVDLSAVEPNEYGLVLRQVKASVKSEALRRLVGS